MEGDHEFLGCPIEFTKSFPDGVTHCRDISRIVVVGWRDADSRLAALSQQPPKGLITGCCRRGGAVLRIEWQQQDTLTPLLLQSVQFRRNGRLPVAHRPIDANIRPACAEALRQ